MNNLWLKDPKDGSASVSLTLLAVSFLLLIGFGAAQALGKVESLGPFTELFYGTTALYFGRRLGIGGKEYTSEKSAEIVNKLENNGSK